MVFIGPPEVKTRLRAQAEKHNVSLSELTRLLISRGLDEIEAAAYVEIKEPEKQDNSLWNNRPGVRRKWRKHLKKKRVELPPTLEDVLAYAFFPHEEAGGKVIQVQLPTKEHLKEFGVQIGQIGMWGGAEVVYGPSTIIVRASSGRIFEQTILIPPKIRYLGYTLPTDPMAQVDSEGD